MPAETPINDRVKLQYIRNKKTNSKHKNKSQELGNSIWSRREKKQQKKTTFVLRGLTWSWIKYFLHASLATSDMMLTIKSLWSLGYYVQVNLLVIFIYRWEAEGKRLTKMLAFFFLLHFLNSLSTKIKRQGRVWCNQSNFYHNHITKYIKMPRKLS
jgi:hypothetical protein